MKRSILSGVGVAAAASMALAACGGGDSGESTDGPVTISLAGWSLSTTPEFQVLADAFHEANPDVTVELKEYDATEYDTQMIADLSAGSAPDLYVLKNLMNFFTYQDGGQLLDVSDVGDEAADVAAVEFYQVDDATYAIPYRQDSWYVYYNKDLFDAAEVEYPQTCWTWEDYASKAQDLTSGLASTDQKAHGTYHHTWQSVIQGFANAQSEGADILSGDYSHLAPYYERAVALQDSGAAVTYGTATTNSLTYQAEFGTQKAAMLPMGSWFVATLIAQQKSGDADTFNWGIAPAPQQDCSADTPVTFGDPTGIGINPAIDDAKVEAAKEFLAFVGSEDAATALAEIGIKPAYVSDAVTETYFSLEGVPTDELSQFAFSTNDTRPENPVSEDTAAIQSILNSAHSEIMSESAGVDGSLAGAEERAADEVLN